MLSNNVDESKSDEIITALTSLGFDPKEAAVYLALLSLGEVGSSKIIKKTSLHGQYVYQALEKLETKGLAQHLIQSGRKRFSAKHPRHITHLINEQQRLSEKVVAELELMMTLPPEQRSEVSKGIEACIEQEFELLKSAAPSAELLIIGGQGDQFIETMSGHLSRYENMRLKKEIRIRYIGSQNQLEVLKNLKLKRKLFDFRVLPGLFTGSVNTNIWPEVIDFNIYGQPVISFTIYNPVIAGSYRQFFETLWHLGKE